MKVQTVSSYISCIQMFVIAIKYIYVHMYCTYHVLAQPNFRRYHFYFLHDQAQIHLEYFNVLDEL